MKHVFLFTAVTLSAAVLAADDPPDGRIIVLEETGDGLRIEAVPLPEGEDVVVSGPDVVTFLLPLGIGQSGDLVQASARGGEIYRDVDVFVADLPVLQSMGLEETGALLGSDFLGRFSEIQVGFGRQVLRLEPVPGR